MSTVPPPQSSTITVASLTICSFNAGSLSSLHYIEAPSGSKQSNKFELEDSSTMPACLAAYRMKDLCSSDQRAGTVSTHLILVFTTFPTYSVNFSKAFSAINFSD
jgi:nitrate reductase NapE component